MNENKPAAGTAPAMRTIKAGCGIRIDPDSLNEEIGFDFSGAVAHRPSTTTEDSPIPDALRTDPEPPPADVPPRA